MLALFGSLVPSILFSVEGQPIQFVGHYVGMCSTFGAILRTMEDYPEHSQLDVIKI